VEKGGLASWATLAFLNCIPAYVATSRFTHVHAVHTHAMYNVHTYMYTCTSDTQRRQPGATFGWGCSRLLVNIPANISLPPFFFRSLVPNLPRVSLLSFRLSSCSFFFTSSRPRNCTVSRANFASSSPDTSEFWDAFERKNLERARRKCLRSPSSNGLTKILLSSSLSLPSYRAKVATRSENLVVHLFVIFRLEKISVVVNATNRKKYKFSSLHLKERKDCKEQKFL